MILKNKKSLFIYVIIVSCFSGCGLGPLGPWNSPKFDEFDWSSFEINYWIIVGKNHLLQRNFLLNDPELIREGMSKISIKEIHGLTVPTSSQMHWNVANGDKWRARPVFSDKFSFTKKGDNLYYSYSVEMENTALFDWLCQKCLQDAQKDYPGVTLANIRLSSSESLKSALRSGRNKIFHLPEPINEKTRSRITNYNDQDAINLSNALKSFEHYDAHGNLKLEKVFNKEFKEALDDVEENFRKYQERRKSMQEYKELKK